MSDVLPAAERKHRYVRTMFDRIAPRYDLMNRLMTAGLDRRWRRELCEAAGVGAGDRVLDLACGTGDLAEIAAARGARVVGVDFAREMLRGAQARALGIALVQSDAAALPFATGALDCVSCGFALRNFVALEPVFAEMARVLRPGGRLAVIEVDRPRNALVRAGHGLYFDRIVPRLGALLSDREAYRYLPASTAYLPPEPELRARLERAGFERVARRARMFGAVQILTAVRRGATS